MNQYIISTLWLLGFLISFWMLRVEHEAEKQQYTQGDRMLIILLSMLSLVMIIFILVKAWVMAIAKTGFWNKPVKQKPE